MLRMKVLLTTLAALTSLAFADGLPTVPYLYVLGSAEVEKKPDMVSLRFKLTEINKDAAVANKAVQAQAVKVFELLKATGIADEDVIANEISSDAEFDEAEKNRRVGKFLGYRVVREFTAKVRDVVKFPKLVNDLFAVKVGYFEGITEEYSKAKEVTGETWETALKNARIEADKMAKAGGMKVDSIWAVSSEAFRSIQGRILGENTSYPVASGPAPERKADAAPEYRLAPVRFSQSVHVIYLISPAK
jgi:uncharacterized protein YggE